MGRRTTVAALAMLLAAWPTPLRGEGGSSGEPFPVGKTTILRKEGAVYTVDGRVRIPAGVEVTCLKDVHIRAKGPGAVIEVEGSLIVHGVGAREVIFEGVTVEPGARFGEIRMDQTIFRGGGGVRTPAERACAGKLFFELMQFQRGTALDVTMSAGSVDLSSMHAWDPIRVSAVDADGKTGNTVRLNVRGCVAANGLPGIDGGLVVKGLSEVVVRLSRLGGALTSISDWRQSLIFDGNKVNSATLEFKQPEAGRFARMTMAKCDIYSSRVQTSAPPAERFKDTCTMDRCWFKGVTDPKALFGKVLFDGADDPKNGTRIVLPKVNDRPLELAGPVDR